MAEKVTPDILNPPYHTLSNNIQHDPNALLKEYESQCAKDETSIGTTPLTSMMIDTGNSVQKGHHLFIDNHYTSMSLATYLSSKMVLTLLGLSGIQENTFQLN